MGKLIATKTPRQRENVAGPTPEVLAPMSDQTTSCECGCGGEVKPRRRFLKGHNRRVGSASDRVYSKIAVNPFGCWEFTGGLTEDGYGVIKHRGANRKEGAHRVAYREAVGDIPDGLTIDHLCMNKRCCNPAHLEPVTRAENVQRNIAAGRGGQGKRSASKTHCPQGHPYAGDNLIIRRGCRECRACRNARNRKAIIT